MNTCVRAACTHTSAPLRLNAVHLPGLLKKKKKKKNLHSLLSVWHFPEALFFFGWWKRAIGFGRLAECGFSIQTNNRAESVSANGDQACQDEGFGDGGGSGTPPLSPPLLSLQYLSFFFFVTESSPLASDRKTMPPVLRAFSRHFHIKDTCEGCRAVLTWKHTLLYCFFFVLLFSVFSNGFTFSVLISVSPFIPREHLLSSSIFLNFPC